MLTLIHVERQNGQKPIHHDRQGALPQALFGIETGIAWQATGFGDMEKAACIRGRFFPPSRGKYFFLPREKIFSPEGKDGAPRAPDGGNVEILTSISDGKPNGVAMYVARVMD